MHMHRHVYLLSELLNDLLSTHCKDTSNEFSNNNVNGYVPKRFLDLLNKYTRKK